MNRILRDLEKLIARFSPKESIFEMAVGDPESVRSINQALRRLKDLAARADDMLLRIDEMAGKTDGEIYGWDGGLPQILNILRIF